MLGPRDGFHREESYAELRSLWRTCESPWRTRFGHSTGCGNLGGEVADDFPLMFSDNRGTSFMSVAQLDVTLDRPLPQSPDAERAVLGSILENPNAFYRVISLVDTEDFFKDAHRLIFAAIRALAEKSVEIDLLTVKNELAK